MPSSTASSMHSQPGSPRLTSGRSPTAQGEVQTSPIATTAANCAIHLSVANPNPGDQEIPRSLVMTGTALDGTATSGTGISQVQAFLTGTCSTALTPAQAL